MPDKALVPNSRMRAGHKIIGLLLFALVCSACHHDQPPNNAGPMQKAGAAVDRGAENVHDAAKDAAHDVKEDLKK
jgi:hypothetical protein